MSWKEDFIPNFRELYASEQRDRAIAFLDLPELIAGVECEPLTPFRMEWLKAESNPFAIGGIVDSSAIVQFLWVINRSFMPFEQPPKATLFDKVLHRKPRTKLQAFVASQLSLDLVAAREGIDAYLDRAFLDAPHEISDDVAYYSATASLLRDLCGEPFRWTYEQVMHTPFRVSYQVLKCQHKAQGGIVINRRSSKAESDWMNAQNTPEKIAERLRLEKEEQARN